MDDYSIESPPSGFQTRCSAPSHAISCKPRPLRSRKHHQTNLPRTRQTLRKAEQVNMCYYLLQMSYQNSPGTILCCQTELNTTPQVRIIYLMPSHTVVRTGHCPEGPHWSSREPIGSQSHCWQPSSEKPNMLTSHWSQRWPTTPSRQKHWPVEMSQLVL